MHQTARPPCPSLALAPRTLRPGRKEVTPRTHAPFPACTCQLGSSKEPGSWRLKGWKEGAGPRATPGRQGGIWCWEKQGRRVGSTPVPPPAPAVTAGSSVSPCCGGEVLGRSRTGPHGAARGRLGRLLRQRAWPRVRLVVAFGRLLLLGFLSLLLLLPLATFFGSCREHGGVPGAAGGPLSAWLVLLFTHVLRLGFGQGGRPVRPRRRAAGAGGLGGQRALASASALLQERALIGHTIYR